MNYSRWDNLQVSDSEEEEEDEEEEDDMPSMEELYGRNPDGWEDNANEMVSLTEDSFAEVLQMHQCEENLAKVGRQVDPRPG